MAAYHPRQIAPRSRSPPVAPSSPSPSHQNTDLLFPSASPTELGWSLVYPQRRRSVSTSFSSSTSGISSCQVSPRVETRGISPPVPVVPLPSSYWHDLGLPTHDGHGNFPSPGITPRASIDGHLGFQRPRMLHRSLSNRTADTYSTIASMDDGLSALDLNDGSECGWDGLESVRNRSEGGSFGGDVRAETGVGTGTGTGMGIGHTAGVNGRRKPSKERRRRDTSPFATVSNSAALSEEGEELGHEREQGSVHSQQSYSGWISSADLALNLHRRHSTLSSVALAGTLIEPSATPSSPARQSMTELLSTSFGSLFQLASSSIFSFLPSTELSYKHSVSLRVIRSIWNVDEDSLMLIFPPPLPSSVEQPIFHELFLKPIPDTVINQFGNQRVAEEGDRDAESETILEALTNDDDDSYDHNDWQPEEF